MTVQIAVLGVCSGAFLFVCIVIWILYQLDQRRIDRNAKRVTARKNGVSLAYTDEVVENIQRLKRGEISYEQWEEQAVQIARHYPQDSGVKEERK